MVPIKSTPALRSNYGGERTRPVEYIVMHYTANDGDTDEGNGSYFARVSVGASAHYFVDDDSITASVPENYVAWHCGTSGTYKHPSCRNGNSIGVELCDTKRDGTYQASDQTLKNAADLVAQLCQKYELPVERVIRHYDVTGKHCPAYWVSGDGLERFREEVSERMAKRYQTVSELPDWAKGAVVRLIEAGRLHGTTGTKDSAGYPEGLDLSEDMVRLIVMLEK